MSSYSGLSGECVMMKGDKDDMIEAYYAKPSGKGPFPGVVLIHHAPGWDQWVLEATRKLAQHGFATIAPHLYHREGTGAPEDIAAKARADGGVPDPQVVEDIAGAMAYLRAQPEANGKVGLIGFCSGGRHVYLAAARLSNVDAVVDCWGGNKFSDNKNDSTKRPVPPIELTDKITAPLLGIYGNDDKNPSPEHVNTTEEILKKAGKTYEFHRYDGAGHGFFNVPKSAYRPEQAEDAWKKIFAFYKKYLAK
jgi:carboxymethylenebutenolidase